MGCAGRPHGLGTLNKRGTLAKLGTLYKLDTLLELRKAQQLLASNSCQRRQGRDREQAVALNVSSEASWTGRVERARDTAVVPFRALHAGRILTAIERIESKRVYETTCAAMQLAHSPGAVLVITPQRQERVCCAQRRRGSICRRHREARGEAVEM